MTGNNGNRNRRAGLPLALLVGLMYTAVACTADAQPAADTAGAADATEAGVAQAAVPTVGTRVKVGRGVYQPVVHHATGDVFASTIGQRGEDEGAVYQLDGETLEVKGTIATPGYMPFGLGIHEASGKLYATDTRNGAVIVIDIETLSVAKIIENEIDDQGHLREVVADETNGRVYVSSYRGNGMIWVIDTETMELVDTFVEVGDGTSGMVLDVPNHRLFAANMSGGDIVEIDLETGEYARTFPAGGERPSNLELDADRGRLWSANQATNDVTIIDVETGEMIESVSTGDQTLGVAYNAANDMMYVTNRRSGTVTAVDAESMHIVTWMMTGSYPNTVWFNDDTGVGYVTNKARSARGGQPAVEDPNGDTVTLLHP